MRVFFLLIVLVMRYAVKIINLVIAELCTTTKLNSFHLGCCPTYLSYNTCKFFFVLSVVYYQDYNTSMRKQPLIVSLRVTFTSRLAYKVHITPDDYTSSATRTDVGSTPYKVFSFIIYQLRQTRVKILFC